jgi:hypothetical protein
LHETLGAEEWLRSLPRLVVCGGFSRASGGMSTGNVWRLDREEQEWSRITVLTGKRHCHACCAVRGTVVALGGVCQTVKGSVTDSVEILRCELRGEAEESSSSRFSRRCRVVSAMTLSQSPSRRARALRVKFFWLAEEGTRKITSAPPWRQYTRWIWRRAGRARARLLSFIRVQAMWPHGWRMGATSVRAGIPAPKRQRRTSRLRVSKCAGSASRSQPRKQAAVRLRVLRNSGLLQQTVCASRLGLTQARVREPSSGARGGTRRLQGGGRLDKVSQPTKQLLAWGLRDQDPLFLPSSQPPTGDRTMLTVVTSSDNVA